ncbi:hypothetical protein AAFF_G00276380 [Aldrovandia affinis]|uniref:Uncharacterized protein n=1 Tax=Aldrovandia affinis TaxID=143900 RepID=A0AAD7RAS8_9TELE|nr:hypothetical protein AAFF_G00276380 [Aldrovandia affinis]
MTITRSHQLEEDFGAGFAFDVQPRSVRHRIVNKARAPDAQIEWPWSPVPRESRGVTECAFSPASLRHDGRAQLRFHAGCVPPAFLFALRLKHSR